MNDDCRSRDDLSFEFQQLLSDLSQGNLTEISSSRLSEMLHADPGRCDALVQFMQMISVLESAEDGVFGRTGQLFEAVNFLGCELPGKPAPESAEKIANFSADSLGSMPSVLRRVWAIVLRRISAATLIAALFAGFASAAAGSLPRLENLMGRTAGKIASGRPSNRERVSEQGHWPRPCILEDSASRHIAKNRRPPYAVNE